MNRYPIYIVSKGRWHSRLTSKALASMRVPHFVVIEQQELDQYAQHFHPAQLLAVPQSYFDEYDTFWPKDSDKRTGPGAARNYAWDHSIAMGNTRHWVMDDNIDAFHRLNRQRKYESHTGAIFEAMEDFVDRYDNVAIAGPNYYSFVKTTDCVPAFITNTRIYSCLLILNSIPYRWRGRYNEDTDLCLRALKDGWCTIQFNAFLQGKVTTQRMTGGNTDVFYKDEGTLNKSKMLQDMHPDCSKVVWKFNRWHHHVDYRRFKGNKLQRKAGLTLTGQNNEYGMKLEPSPKTCC